MEVRRREDCNVGKDGRTKDSTDTGDDSRSKDSIAIEKRDPGRNVVEEESIEIAWITGRMAVRTGEKYLTFVDRMEGNGAESTGETGVTRGS